MRRGLQTLFRKAPPHPARHFPTYIIRYAGRFAAIRLTNRNEIVLLVLNISYRLNEYLSLSRKTISVTCKITDKATECWQPVALPVLFSLSPPPCIVGNMNLFERKLLAVSPPAHCCFAVWMQGFKALPCARMTERVQIQFLSSAGRQDVKPASGWNGARLARNTNGLTE